MRIYRKLVRDRIPAIIHQQGNTCETRVLSDAEYREELRRKLSEEVAEYLASEELEELADILEVIHSLAAAGGHSVDKLEAVRAQKERERGGFSERTYLVHVSDIGD